MKKDKNTPSRTRLLDQHLPRPISMTAIPMELSVSLPDATGSVKSKMAASKLQVR